MFKQPTKWWSFRGGQKDPRRVALPSSNTRLVDSDNSGSSSVSSSGNGSGGGNGSGAGSGSGGFILVIANVVTTLLNYR